MPNTTQFASEISEFFEILVFGKRVLDLQFTDEGRSTLGRQYDAELINLVTVYGVRALGICHKFEVPVTFILPGEGEPPSGCGEFSEPSEFLMWRIRKGTQLATLTHSVDTIEALVSKNISILLDTFSDFSIRNIRLEGTKIKGEVRAYLRLRQRGPLGTTIFDITVIDRTDSFEIDFFPGQCFTIFEIGVAKLQICVYSTPNRVCGTIDIGVQLPIGYWGKKFDIACVNF